MRGRGCSRFAKNPKFCNNKKWGSPNRTQKKSDTIWGCLWICKKYAFQAVSNCGFVKICLLANAFASLWGFDDWMQTGADKMFWNLCFCLFCILPPPLFCSLLWHDAKCATCWCWHSNPTAFWRIHPSREYILSFQAVFFGRTLSFYGEQAEGANCSQL